MSPFPLCIQCAVVVDQLVTGVVVKYDQIYVHTEGLSLLCDLYAYYYDKFCACKI